MVPAGAVVGCGGSALAGNVADARVTRRGLGGDPARCFISATPAAIVAIRPITSTIAAASDLSCDPTRALVAALAKAIALAAGTAEVTAAVSVGGAACAMPP